MTSFDVKTVKKYVHQADFNPPSPKIQQRSSKLDPYKKDINSWMEEDKHARKKHRHTARRIHDRLVEKYGQSYDCL